MLVSQAKLCGGWVLLILPVGMMDGQGVEMMLEEAEFDRRGKVVSARIVTLKKYGERKIGD